MSGVLLLLLFVVALAVLGAFVYYTSRQERLQNQLAAVGRSVQEQQRLIELRIQSFQQQMENRLRDQTGMLSNTQQQIGSRLESASQMMGVVQNRLGQMEEANRRIFEVGKDIRSLQDILRAPKPRGILGEFFLEELLSQMLPRDHFKLQYAFKSNEKADAVICLAHGLVAVDAKFPLENFKRYLETETDPERQRFHRDFVSDARKHVDAIARKYILPDEGTLDFALMYIHAENVYYELAVADARHAEQGSLVDYAVQKRIIPVSPNTLFAYLQTVLLGLRGLKIEERSREILNMVSQLRVDFEKLDDDMSKTGKQLKYAVDNFNECRKHTERMHTKIEIAQHADDASVVGVPIGLVEQDSDPSLPS